MAMTITKAKAALKEKLAEDTTAQAVEQAFLQVVKSNTEITSGDDISKITKAALLLTHSDKTNDENAEELTKKLTNIMSSVQGGDLNDAKLIVNETLQPATTFTQQNTAPTQTDVGAYTKTNYKKLDKLMSLIELGDKLGLTSKRATKYLNNTLSDHEKISTTDLKDEITVQVIAVQKKLNTALQSKLKQLPQSDYNQSLQNKLKELDNGKVTKTEDYTGLYDRVIELKFDAIINDPEINDASKNNVRELKEGFEQGLELNMEELEQLHTEEKIKTIGEKFDGIIKDPKIEKDAKDIVSEFKEQWSSGNRETTVKELKEMHQSLKKEYPSEQQSLKKEYPSKTLSFIYANKHPNVGDSKDTNKENEDHSDKGPKYG